RVSRQVAGLNPVDPVVQAWLTIKASAADPDNVAVIQKAIITTVGAAGEIVDDGSTDGTADLYFILLASDTTLLVGGNTYSFDVQVKTQSGAIRTVEIGTLAPIGQITQSTS